MSIRLPLGLVIGGTVLLGLASIASLAKELPEIWRYLKTEGM
jgi:hypothetical protein